MIYKPTTLPGVLQETWKSSIHDLNNLTFVVEDGTKFEIAPDARRWKSLGKKVLIVDVDSRLDLNTGAMLNPDSPDKNTMKGRTGGILNHLLYGKFPDLETSSGDASKFNPLTTLSP